MTENLPRGSFARGGEGVPGKSMRPVATAMRRVWHKACLLTKKACLLTSMLFASSIISERSKDSVGTSANLNPCSIRQGLMPSTLTANRCAREANCSTIPLHPFNAWPSSLCSNLHSEIAVFGVTEFDAFRAYNFNTAYKNSQLEVAGCLSFP